MKNKAFLFLLLVIPILGCFAPLQNIEKAAIAEDCKTLVLMLEHGKYSYVRENAARALRENRLQCAKKDHVVAVLKSRLADPNEYSYVRTECAMTLTQLGTSEAISIIIEAIQRADDGEERYWLARALHMAGTTDALGMLENLRDDSYLYVSAAVSQWLETTE